MKKRSNNETLWTGGTVSDLKRRYWNHKCNPDDLFYKKVRSLNINWNDVKIELITEYKFCTNRQDLDFAAQLAYVDEETLHYYLDNI